MTEVLKSTVNKVSDSRAAKKVCMFCRILYKTLEILVLGGVGGWLIYRDTDSITIGVGVALGIWAILKLVNIAYLAESAKGSKVESQL